MENAALGSKRRGSGAAGTDQANERLLSFAEGNEGEDGTGGEDDWLATHIDSQGAEGNHIGDIADMPDADPAPAGAASLSAGEEDDLASRVAGASIGAPDVDEADDEVGDIPDMDDDDEDGILGSGGVVEHEDTATAAPVNIAATAAASSSRDDTGAINGDNILSVRTYDCLITYDKYYQTPRMWLVGYDENGVPLKPSQIFEDISSDYAQKTVTIEPFPHSATMSTASIHPCKHASVMKKVIERMDAGVREEQKRIRLQQQQGDAAGGTTDEKQKKKKWGLGGAMKKVASSRSTSGNSVSAANNASGEAGAAVPADASLEVEGLRVDQYMLVFLKFMASIVPAIEIDATQSF